jgi:hypothetical protein
LTPEQTLKKLQDFWLMDSSEYSIIKDLIIREIEALERNNDQDDINLRNFLIIMKEKVDYIITNGLCKQYHK